MSTLRPVIVGYGHAGRDLHHRCLLDLAERGLAPAGEVLVVDPRPPRDLPPGTSWVQTLDAAVAALPDPGDGVFHVTTPVGAHVPAVEALLAAGAKRIVLEKPVTRTSAQARQLAAGAATAGAWIIPVSVWPSSSITRRVAELIASDRIGTPIGLNMAQNKPRFRRSAADTDSDCGHRTAFEVELPHQVLLALHLGGPAADIIDAASWDMRLPDRSLPGMGGARVRLQHGGGFVSKLSTDLTAPMSQRRLTVTGTTGAIVADYPISGEDDFGQVWVSGDRERQVLVDGPLSRFLRQAYAHFAGEGPAPDCGLDSHIAAIELLERAALQAGPTAEPAEDRTTAGPVKEEVLQC
jgi:predicted dehydrogenase